MQVNLAHAVLLRQPARNAERPNYWTSEVGPRPIDPLLNDDPCLPIPVGSAVRTNSLGNSGIRSGLIFFQLLEKVDEFLMERRGIVHVQRMADFRNHYFEAMRDVFH